MPDLHAKRNFKYLIGAVRAEKKTSLHYRCYRYGFEVELADLLFSIFFVVVLFLQSFVVRSVNYCGVILVI